MGAPDADDDYEKLDVSDRLVHKLWKARVSAYNSLSATFRDADSESDPVLRPYATDPNMFHRAVTDSNAIAQENGVSMLADFVAAASSDASNRLLDVLLESSPNLIDKGLGSTRAGTRTKSIEVLLLMIQSIGSSDPLTTRLLSHIAKFTKQPKVLTAIVSVLTHIVLAFGLRPDTCSDPKPILKALPTLFAHSDKNVRQETNNLIDALYVFLGEPVFSSTFSAIKPVQASEIKQRWQDFEAQGTGKGSKQPERLTRTQQRNKDVQEAVGQLEGVSANDLVDNQDDGSPQEDDPAAQDRDPYDLVDIIEISSKMPSDFETNIASSKWKDRKELALDPLLAALQPDQEIIRIESKDPSLFDRLASLLAQRVLSDANVLCVTTSTQIISRLAVGLRDGWARHAHTVMPSLIEKLKEKKVSVVECLSTALYETFRAVQYDSGRSPIGPLTTILPFCIPALTHKNPNVKCETINFISRCLSDLHAPPKLDESDDTKRLPSALKTALEDSAEVVRNAAVNAIGTLRKLLPPKDADALISGLDDARTTKIKDAQEKAIVKAKLAPPSKARNIPPQQQPPKHAAPKLDAAKKAKPPLSSAGVKPIPSSSSSTNSTAKPSTPIPKAPIKKPPITGAPKTNGGPNTKKPGTAASISVPSASGETVKYTYATSAEANEKAKQLLPADVVEEISSSNWKARLAAMESLCTYLDVKPADNESAPGLASGASVETTGSIADLDSEMIVRFLATTPGWKESNFQVFGKSISILRHLAIASPSFHRSSVALAAPPLIDKLGDIKSKKNAADALTLFAERISLPFVLSQCFESISKQKAPKAQAEALTWLDQVLKEFGVNGIPLRDLIAVLTNCLKSSNATVRSSATKALVTLKLFIGSNVTEFLQDLNPTLLSTIDSEFAAVDGQQAPQPIRFSSDEATSSSKKGASRGTGANKDSDLDELFTRYELEKIVPSSIISASNDTNWKTRKEAMENLQGILENHKRFKPGLGDLGGALKARCGDSNKVVQGLALDAVTRIASGMNKPFERHVKQIVPSVLNVLADQKAPVRAAALDALTAIADAVGIDNLIPFFETCLQQTNPLLRKELLLWLSNTRFENAHQVSVDFPNLDLKSLCKPVLACVEDRNGEVRKATQSFLPIMLAFVGYSNLMEHVSELKPASRAIVTPFIEAVRSTAPKLAKSSTATTSSTAAGNKRTSHAEFKHPAGAGAGVSHAQRPPSSASTSTTTRASSPANMTRGPRTTSLVKRPPNVGSKQLPPLPPEAVENSNMSSGLPTGITRPRPGSSASLAKGGNTIGSYGGRNNMASRHAVPSPTPPPPAPVHEADMPFKTLDAKFKLTRGNKEIGAQRWTLVDGIVRPDQVEYLHNQMGPHVSPEMLGMMFSKDHHAERDHIAALDIIYQCLSETSDVLDEYYGPEAAATNDKRIVANSDLIIKYLSVRMADTNTTVTLKVLDTLDVLMTFLNALEQRLSDYEGSCLLPSLIAKLGDQKEIIRNRVRAIFKSLGLLYPYSRVFSSLVDYGLKSKNARTRAESAEELAGLVHRLGMTVCPQPHRAIPNIAALLGDRDGAVRNATLNVLSNIYSIIGDEMYASIGELSEKSRSILNERLKRSGNGPSSSSSSPPPTSGIASPRSAIPKSSSATGISRIGAPGGGSGRVLAPGSSRLPGALGSSLRKPNAAPPGTPQQGSTSAPSSLASPSAGGKRIRPPSTMLPPVSGRLREPGYNSALLQQAQLENERTDEIIEDLIKDICTDDPVTSVEALKGIQREIAQSVEKVLPHADAMINAINQQMKFAFEDLHHDSPPFTMRLCKHLMQTLSNFFDKREQGTHVSRESLLELLAELTHRLLDTADQTDSDTISGLSKVLNMVLIRIFHHSDQGSCFGSLFTLLHQVTYDMRDLHGDELAGRARYAELVMKCLWKVSKTVKQSLDDETLDARILLHDIDDFLTSIPPAEWRRRATDSIPLGDMPLRTVKTILQQVVSVFHNDVYDKLELIVRPENSFVYQYLYRLLNNNSARSIAQDERGITSPTPSANTGRQTGSGRTSALSGDRESTPDPKETLASHGEPGTPMRGGGGVVSSPGGFRSSDIEENQRLKEIFDQIGNPRDSKKGITELYRFQKEHPSAEGRINNWISGTGSYFQSYIRRGLENLSNEDADRNSMMVDSPRRTSDTPMSRRESVSSNLGTVQQQQPKHHNNGESVSSTSSSHTGNNGGASELRRSRNTLSTSSKDDNEEDRKKLMQLHAMFGYTDKSTTS